MSKQAQGDFMSIFTFLSITPDGKPRTINKLRTTLFLRSALILGCFSFIMQLLSLFLGNNLSILINGISTSNLFHSLIFVFYIVAVLTAIMLAFLFADSVNGLFSSLYSANPRNVKKLNALILKNKDGFAAYYLVNLVPQNRLLTKYETLFLIEKENEIQKNQLKINSRTEADVERNGIILELLDRSKNQK